MIKFEYISVRLYVAEMELYKCKYACNQLIYACLFYQGPVARNYIQFVNYISLGLPKAVKWGKVWGKTYTLHVNSDIRTTDT